MPFERKTDNYEFVEIPKKYLKFLKQMKDLSNDQKEILKQVIDD